MGDEIFYRSVDAAERISRKGDFIRTYQMEAARAPRLKNAFLSVGVHPVYVWLRHYGFSSAKGAQYLGVDRDTYECLGRDPDGAFSKVSPDMILRFCHNTGVHPAHIGSLEEDFRQSVPSALLVANMLVASGEEGLYSRRDRGLAAYAIEIERRRYAVSFHDDPECGRLAEKFDELDDLSLTRLFGLAAAEPENIWSFEGLAALACEYLQDLHEEDLKQYGFIVPDQMASFSEAASVQWRIVRSIFEQRDILIDDANFLVVWRRILVSSSDEDLEKARTVGRLFGNHLLMRYGDGDGLAVNLK